MRTQFKKFYLGAAGIKFVRQYLSNGLTLAQLLLERLPLDRGTVTTYLPEEVTKEEAEEFESGGKIKTDPSLRETRVSEDGRKWIFTPVQDNLALIMPHLLAYMFENHDRICIFENASGGAEDPCIVKIHSNIYLYHNEVYHFVNPANIDSSSIETAIRKARSYRLLGVGTSVNGEKYRDTQKRTVNIEELKMFAKNTEILVVRAYDGEGYLIWDNRDVD